PREASANDDNLGSPLRYRGCTDDRSGSCRRDRPDKIPSIELPNTHGVDGKLLPLRLVPFRDSIDFRVGKTLGDPIHNGRAALARSECSHLRRNVIGPATNKSRNASFNNGSCVGFATPGSRELYVVVLERKRADPLAG